MLSDSEWDRLRIAWTKLHPQCYPEQARMLSDAVEALEHEAETDKLSALVHKKLFQQTEAFATEVRTLLVRYIAHVRDCEGVDFIGGCPYPNEKNFTDAEWVILKQLAEESRNI